MDDEDCTIAQIGAFLEDATARRILAETSREPMSAESLSEAAGASKPTIYRRVNELRECDLLVERTRPDPEAGHHHTVYATDLERIIVELSERGFAFDIERREGMAARFTRLVEEM